MLRLLRFQSLTAPPLGYARAFLLAVVALGLSLLLLPIAPDFVFLLVTAAVALAAWQAGVGPGVSCALLAILLISFFVFDPASVIASPAILIKFGFLLGFAVLMGWLETARGRANKQLQDQASQLAAILDSVADGVTAQDASGTVVFANQAAAKLTGYPSPDAMLATPVSTLQRKFQMMDDRGQTLSYAAMPRHAVFKNGQADSLRFQMRFADTGEERWVRLTSAPLFDQAGNVKLAVNVFRDITERMNIEQDLARYAALVQDSADGIISKSLDGTIISWNPGAEQIYGYTAAEAIGQNIRMLYTHDMTEQESHLPDRLRHGEKIVQYETRRVCKDGREIDISLTISPLRNVAGEITGLAAIERDITERNQLLRQIEQDRRKLATILNAIPGIIYEGSGNADAGQQQMDFVSEYAEEMLGYALEEWYSAPNFWQRVIHPDDWQEAVQQANATYDQGSNDPVPFRCITKNGDILFAESYNAVIADENGKRIGTCGIVMNITERKRREQEIAQLTALIENQRRRLNSIIRNLPGIVFDVTIDPESGTQTVNFISEYTQNMLGYSPAEWKADPNFWQKIVNAEDLEAAFTEVKAAFENERMGVVQFRCTHANGDIVYAESFFSFAVEEASVRQYGVIMDISDRKESEQAIQQYTNELRRSNEELEQFAYVASHDLQEPLRMVTSYLQLLEQRYSERLDDDAHEFINYAVDGASRMKTLIGDLLAYSRVQRTEVEFSAVNMQVVLDQVCHNLQIPIEDTQATITHDELPIITANERQMVQLFQNLIGNAIKFHSNEPPRVHISAQRQGAYWRFAVKDNGIGIDAAYQERIFVIFQRLHPMDAYAGTGIGLAICRKIVEKHNGKIWFESQPGAGTTFYLTIPLMQRRKLVKYASN